MTQEEELKIKEIVYLAVQSTKEENSGLIGHLERIMKEQVKEAIEINVNGKIRNLTTMVVDHNTMVDTYIKEDKADNERMKEETQKWRKDADEKLQLVGNVQGFGKVALYFGGFIVTIGGAVALLLKWLHNN